jgi:predicted glycoside hydrolase/deacetylase ChbG (UPF0249 family)
MCHPGYVDETLTSRDAVTNAREEELRYLASDDCERDLATAELQIGQLRSPVSRNIHQAG